MNNRIEEARSKLHELDGLLDDSSARSVIALFDKVQRGHQVRSHKPGFDWGFVLNGFLHISLPLFGIGFGLVFFLMYLPAMLISRVDFFSFIVIIFQSLAALYALTRAALLFRSRSLQDLFRMQLYVLSYAFPFIIAINIIMFLASIGCCK